MSRFSKFFKEIERMNHIADSFSPYFDPDLKEKLEEYIRDDPSLKSVEDFCCWFSIDYLTAKKLIGLAERYLSS